MLQGEAIVNLTGDSIFKFSGNGCLKKSQLCRMEKLPKPISAFLSEVLSRVYFFINCICFDKHRSTFIEVDACIFLVSFIKPYQRILILSNVPRTGKEPSRDLIIIINIIIYLENKSLHLLSIDFKNVFHFE